MYEWTRIERWRFGATRSAGLGALAGGVEALGQALSLRLSLSPVEFLGLALLAIAVMSAYGVVCGVVAGAVHAALRHRPAPSAVSIQLGLAATLLCATYLIPAASVLIGEGRPAGAAAMASMPVALFFVVYFNAHYFLRRFDLGVEYRVGFLPFSGAVALLFALGATGVFATRYTGGAGALEGDPNVVILSVPGLRRDYVRTTWGGSPVGTPAWDAVADGGGVTFADAVTPTPVTRAAHATVLTGLHPLRHRVLAEDDPLYRGFKTLPEVLDKEGYATAAFTSTPAAVASSGLSQGFRIYEDTGPLWSRLLVVSAFVAEPGARPADEVLAGFERWLDRHQTLPWMAWIELGELSAWERDDGVSASAYGDAVVRVDAAYGALRGLLADRELSDRTLVIVHGSHGQMLGEHGRIADRSGLWEELVRVPLLLDAPGRSFAEERVEAQIRLTDVAPTALGYLGIDGFEQTEGVNLLDYADGRRVRPMWSALVGHDDGVLLGMRANGVKYTRRLADDRRTLFALDTDPAEADDLFESNPQTVADAERLLAGDLAALRKLVGR